MAKKSFIKIDKESWQTFINNAAIRSELDNCTKDYKRGYLKGLQVALLDLLNYSELEYKDYRDDVSQLLQRIDNYIEGETPAEDN